MSSTWYVGPNGEGSWADFDGDGIIDERDFEMLKPCYLAITREGHSKYRPECAKFDLNDNGQVAVEDFGLFADILARGYDSRTNTQLQSADPVKPAISWGWLVLWGLVLLAFRKGAKR